MPRRTPTKRTTAAAPTKARGVRVAVPAPDARAVLPTSAPATHVEWVAHRLRDMILRGLIESGEKIYPAKLAEEWKVSPTPLREAIQRLASEGLLEVTPQRGARVATVSARQAKEYYELRILLEPLALRDSLSRFTDEDRRLVSEAFDAYRKAWQGQTEITYAMYETHKHFHDMTLRRCSSQQLVTLVSQLTVHCMRYTTWLAKRDRIKEHRLIADAMAKGSLDEVTVAVVEHSLPGLSWAQQTLVDQGEQASTFLSRKDLSAVTKAIVATAGTRL